MKNKSNGIDVVPVKIFKHLRDLISPILAVLINMSLQVGIFPDLLKVAKVIPLHKAAELFLLGKYKSNLCFRSVAKFLKRLCINNYIITSLGIISYLAIGLVSDLNQLSYIYEQLDNNNYVFSLFLDFKKAFDSVDHKILLSKLKHYGIRGTCYNWFESYLTD